MLKYFLYARKSTDVEDKQILSIEAQLAELDALAKRERLNVVEVFVEKQSAKMPGRPVFNDMMARIQKGEAQGIVCWKIDRLARNPIDGGQIQWLLQNKVIAHIQTNDRGYFPTDNVLMMSVEFGMANQYIRDLSVNTARGLRAKARRGDFPGTAPVGYLNDPRTKTIVTDRKKSKVIRAAFELYAKARSRYEDIGQFLFDNDVRTRSGKCIHDEQVAFILSNSFYYGHFKYSGEIYEGRHTPIVSKQLFDKVQKVMSERSHPTVPDKAPKVYCGLMSCGECGMSITAEKQKGHTYYRCTKKSAAHCSQSYVREEHLTADFSDILSPYVLDQAWANDFRRRMQTDEREGGRITATAVDNLRDNTEDIDRKLDRLTDVYIAQDIERDAYLSKRRVLMSDKRTLEEHIARLQRDSNAWLEPMQTWVNEARNLAEIQKDPSLPAKKSALQKIFGSNLKLQDQKVSGTAHPLYAAVAAARKNSEISDLGRVMVLGPGLEPGTPSSSGKCSTN